MNKIISQEGMVEQRKFKRTTVVVSAKVLVERIDTLIPCDVLDLTHQGARLNPEAILFSRGELVEFTFDNYRTVRRARVAWANAPELGIEFDRNLTWTSLAPPRPRSDTCPKDERICTASARITHRVLQPLNLTR